jgi:hypothetical protein
MKGMSGEITHKDLDHFERSLEALALRNASDILLPCPFCGSLRVRVFFSSSTFVECRDCGTHGPQIGDHVKTDDLGAKLASQKWNGRVPRAT